MQKLSKLQEITMAGDSSATSGAVGRPMLNVGGWVGGMGAS